VLVKDCKFKNEIPLNLQPQNKRGRAIHMAATGIMISNTSFEDFKAGINSEGYTPLPTCVSYIYDNTFSGLTNSINLSSQAYGDVQGNSISNMIGYSSTIPVGVMLDHTLGSFVGCNNIIDGSQGTPGNIGTIINNNSNYDAAHVIRNQFLNLSRATQTQKNNTALNIHCNQYANNQTALCINPGSANGNLKDQGTGCGSSPQYRAGNTFSGNNKDIASYLNTTTGSAWDYYYFVGASTSQTPVTTSGNLSLDPCNFGTATTDPNSQCNKLLTCLRYVSVQNELVQKMQTYLVLVASGKKTSDDAAILRAQLIRGFGLLDDVQGLKTFLKSENDANADRMLIPLYIELGEYSNATSTIGRLSLSTTEKNAYNDYYNLLIDLKQNNRDITMLNIHELQLVQTMAASNFEVSPYAKAILDWTNIEPWEHEIEEELSAPLQRTLSAIQFQNERSKLYNAVPNPSNNHTTITVFIAREDASQQPKLAISNMMGKEIMKYNLVEGENKLEINTGDLVTGLYTYSFILQGKLIQTNKLSIVK
jgi:hypothetical protein